jgi:hypothetical protein
MIKTVGVEVEAFVFVEKESREGRLFLEPVDVYSWLLENYGSEEIHISSSRVVVKTDAGRHLIEFAFPPLSPENIVVIPYLLQLTLEKLRVPRNWILVFQGVDPRGLSFDPKEWAPKPRYHAMWEAAKKEVVREYGSRNRDLWKGILAASRIASTHVHLGLDLDNPKAINVFNYFNRPLCIQSDGLLDYASSDRLTIWQNPWASHRRLPTFNLPDCSEFRSPEEVYEYASFRSMEEMWLYWRSIPRFIRKVSKGDTEVWEPDLETMSEPGDPVAEGTIWWFCRPRLSLGTAEIRIADSMPPERIVPYVYDVLTRANNQLRSY